VTAQPPDPLRDLQLACELHDADRLGSLLDSGLDPSAPIGGKLPVVWLLEMYTRSDRFTTCLRTLLDRGAVVGDALLSAVLLDEPEAIRTAAAIDGGRALGQRISMASTFTPLEGASLLHVAAEFGHARAAQVLLELGVPVDARAALDADGLGGHTPLFHTVNSNAHRAAPVMHLLLAAGADPQARVPGLTWGRGFEWESTFFDLTPIAYAQLGLLPQMHRDPRHIDAAVRALLAAAGRPIPAMANVPNRYVVEGR
jgi:ankyrin repeat protein